VAGFVGSRDVIPAKNQPFDNAPHRIKQGDCERDWGEGGISKVGQNEYSSGPLNPMGHSIHDAN